MDISEINRLTDIIEARVAHVGDGLTADDGRVDSISTPSAPTVSRFTDIQARSLAWLWPGWIPAGVLTILGGHVGDGKSTVVSALVAALTSGHPMPDGTTVPTANVLILSAEDDPARVIHPRLVANNADLDRVFIMDATTPAPGHRTLDLHTDADHLRTIIETHDIRLLVIDSFGSFLRRSDRASEGAIRDALQPLMTVIAATGVAALGVMRIGKTTRNRNPAQRLVGSSAVPAIARSVIMVARAGEGETEDTDTDISGRAILQVVKSNYASAPPPVTLHLTDTGTVHWRGPAAAGIDEQAETAIDHHLTKSERADAAAFLREYLKDESVRASTVLAQAKDLGFTEITIRRAKKDVGICSFRDTANYGAWTWRLPTKRDIAARARRESVAKSP